VTIPLQLGLNIIRSYKRLSYTPWHAIAEFVDNSTQSYFDHQDELDPILAASGQTLEISIVYDRHDPRSLSISDNAMGMSLDDLHRALQVGIPPDDIGGRSQYGLGMKTAACWIGDVWTVRTKRLNDEVEYEVVVDVERVASGNADLPVTEIPGRDPGAHGTTITIDQLHHNFQTRTQTKIRQFLGSMYRQDLRDGRLKLLWQGEELEWDDSEEQFVAAPDGSRYRKDFEFDVNGKRVFGWVGVLDRGSRSKAGFSILRANRVIKGWPDSWRPSKLYGQLQGSNDLVNQRLIGEIHLNEFEVTHTKDDIMWMGDEEEKVDQGLLDHCGDYKEFAKVRRRGAEGRGPSEVEIQTAVDELTREIESPQLGDIVRLAVIPAPQLVDATIGALIEHAQDAYVTFGGQIADLTIKGFLTTAASPNDPYVAVDATQNNEVMVVVNVEHPHFRQLKGAEGVLNYLRHCTFDAVAEWKARQQQSPLTPQTITILKDQLLRVPFEIEMAENDAPEVDRDGDHEEAA
jgi:hypothetical protein